MVPTDILSLLYLLFGSFSWYTIDLPVGKGQGKRIPYINWGVTLVMGCKPIFLPH